MSHPTDFGLISRVRVISVDLHLQKVHLYLIVLVRFCNCESMTVLWYSDVSDMIEHTGSLLVGCTWLCVNILRDIKTFNPVSAAEWVVHLEVDIGLKQRVGVRWDCDC